MKILYTNASSQLGGAERNLIDDITAIGKQEPTIECIVLITAAPGALSEELTVLGAKVIHLPLPPRIAQMGDSGLATQGRVTKAIGSIAKLAALFDLITYWWQFRQTIVRIAPDLIHSNGFKTHLLTASLGISTPIVWHLHDFIRSRSAIGKLLKLFVGKVSSAIAISQAVSDDWQQLFPNLNIDLIYNAIDTEKFRPMPTVARDNGKIKIGLVATYALWKGQDILIESISILAKRQPELRDRVEFYIIGGAIYQTDLSQFSRSQLQQLARDLNVLDWLHFIDFQRDIVASYNMLDIIVHASTKPEPFGRTIVEAMACEKAVIVANAGGAAELFTDRVDAIGVTPGDPQLLAAAILELILDPTQRTALGTAARQTAIDRFGLDLLGDRLVTLYRKLLSYNYDSQNQVFGKD